MANEDEITWLPGRLGDWAACPPVGLGPGGRWWVMLENSEKPEPAATGKGCWALLPLMQPIHSGGFADVHKKLKAGMQTAGLDITFLRTFPFTAIVMLGMTRPGWAVFAVDWLPFVTLDADQAVKLLQTLRSSGLLQQTRHQAEKVVRTRMGGFSYRG